MFSPFIKYKQSSHPHPSPIYHRINIFSGDQCMVALRHTRSKEISRASKTRGKPGGHDVCAQHTTVPPSPIQLTGIRQICKQHAGHCVASEEETLTGVTSKTSKTVTNKRANKVTPFVILTTTGLIRYH